MSEETLMSFEYIPSKGEIPLSLNRAKIVLLRSLKAWIWHLNKTSQSIGSNFVKINPIDFDNFRISDK